MRRLLVPVVLMGALAACRGDRSTSGASSGGTLVVAIAADAGSLFPPLAMTPLARAATDNIFERLADMGPELGTIGDKNFSPRLASRWEWGADSMSVAFMIDPKARFHDGVPVRAADVRFTFELARNPALGSAYASLITNIDSVTLRDSMTAVVWFKRRTPERFYDFAYQLFILPKHLLDTIPVPSIRASNFVRHPIGSGRFRFVRWDAGARLEIAADTTHPRGRPALDRVIWTIVPDPMAALARLTSGEADVVDRVRAEQIADLAKTPTVRVETYRSLEVIYLLFNERARGSGAASPYFADARVRRALTEGLDRVALARNVFDSLAVVPIAPVPRPLLGGDTSVHTWAFDTTHAAAVLDSAGWRRGTDGRRMKDGKPLTFSVLLPSPSRVRVRLATLAQEAYRRLGVTLTLETVDPPVFFARLGTRDFDAVVQGYVLDPSPFGARQYWSAGPGNAPVEDNVGAYLSPSFNALMDSASTARSTAASSSFLARAWQTINDDAPGIWLAEPRAAIGMNRRVQPGALRADGWWANLADWRIAADGRLPRDGAAPR